MTTTLDKLDQARSNIKSQTRRSDYSELMSYKCPPTKSVEMMSLPIILLGTIPKKNSLPNGQLYEWLEIAKRLNSPDIIDSIINLESIPKETLDKAKAFIEQHPDTFSERSVGNCSLSLAYQLVSWSFAFIKHEESKNSTQ